MLVVGRVVCDRWEFGFEVMPGAQGHGSARKVARAVAGLMPAAGFVPVAAEVLFPHSRA